MSAAPHHDGYANALDGSATAAYSTPSFISLDKPRSLTLLYGSGMASPTALIQVDAFAGEGELPVRMSIRVRNRHGGAWENLGGGSSETFFAYSGGWSRLAAQIETGALASGAYMYDITVRSHWSDGTWTEADPVPVRILVVNERSSPYGMGWIIAGLQRVIPGSGGILLHEGDGTARWFSHPGSCTGTQTSRYCAYTSPEGDFTRLVTDAQTGGWARRYPDGTIVEFGPDGRMRKQTGIEYGYDAGGRLRTVTDRAGQATTVGYDGAGRLAWIRDPAGRQVDVRVLSSGLVDWICDPAGCALSFSYDSRQRLASQTDRGGARWNYEYDAFGKLARAIAPGVPVEGQGVVRPSTRFRSLEAASLPTSGTGTSSNPAPQAAPGSARLTLTSPGGSVVTMSVDRFRSPLRIEEPLGRVTTIERDSLGRPVRTTAFSGDVTEYTYTGGLLATVRDVAANRTTTYTWTAYGHLMYPVGTVLPGYPLEVSTPGEPVARYEKAGDDPYPVQMGSARYMVDDWDSYSRPELLYGPGGHTQYYYAAGGARNLDSVTVFRGTDTLTTRFTRDSFGRVTRTVDATGMTTTVAYDALNRPTSTTDPTGTTSYAYAPAGWLQTLTDARSQAYTYQRNALGWLEWERDPRGQTMYLGYDVDGQQVSATNRRGQTVRYTHD